MKFQHALIFIDDKIAYLYKNNIINEILDNDKNTIKEVTIS